LHGLMIITCMQTFQGERKWGWYITAEGRKTRLNYRRSEPEAFRVVLQNAHKLEEVNRGI